MENYERIQKQFHQPAFDQISIGSCGSPVKLYHLQWGQGKSLKSNQICL